MLTLALFCLSGPTQTRGWATPCAPAQACPAPPAPSSTRPPPPTPTERSTEGRKAPATSKPTACQALLKVRPSGTSEWVCDSENQPVLFKPVRSPAPRNTCAIMRSLQVLPVYKVAPEGPQDSSSLADVRAYPPNSCLPPGSCRLVGGNAGVPVVCRSVLWSLGHLG